nr:putative 4-hydroxy-2-oxoglutarate aldolase, mitochondrial [Quercus suber]
MDSYHYPGVTNNLYIAPATFEKLAAHPNIVGCKLSHGIIDDQTLIAANPRIDHAHFSVFTGLGQNLLPVLTIGGVAAIDGLAGIFPRIVVKLFNLYNESTARGVTKKDIQEMRTQPAIPHLRRREDRRAMGCRRVQGSHLAALEFRGRDRRPAAACGRVRGWRRGMAQMGGDLHGPEAAGRTAAGRGEGRVESSRMHMVLRDVRDGGSRRGNAVELCLVPNYCMLHARCEMMSRDSEMIDFSALHASRTPRRDRRGFSDR